MEPHKYILVTGANGQLGKELKRLAVQVPDFEFLFLSREDLPVHHPEMVRHYFNTYHPAYLINAAAYTAVDRAESEKDLAFQVNAEAVGILAAVCRQYGTRLIHISTDYVFDGQATAPYQEGAPTGPQCVYGASKCEGERQVAILDPDAVVIRTSWVYSEYGKNFVKTMLALMRERNEVRVVNDQSGCPTYAADLARAILDMIGSGSWHPGVYHFCNEGVTTWFEFAEAIRDLTGLPCRVLPIPTSDFPTAARRPAYSALDTSRIAAVWGIRPRAWKRALADCLKRLG
ncbi:MAG: hypothetical protein RJA57_1557 [Bacteroidota bacterium]|jgi:dTDP-4-dehydrorhamnose reductase